MRLFFALWPDPAVQHALGEWARACHRMCGGRSPATDRLHMTIAFLGEVDATRYASVVRIGGAVGAAAFDFVLDRIAYWRRTGIVYAAPSVVPAALSALATDLTERLASAGFPADERPFAPHVTLLRDAKRAFRGAAFAPLAWKIAALSLVETTRADGKPVYRVLESWTLAG